MEVMHGTGLMPYSEQLEEYPEDVKKQYAGKAGVWRAEEGRIVCQGGGGGWLGTERDYAVYLPDWQDGLRSYLAERAVAR